MTLRASARTPIREQPQEDRDEHEPDGPAAHEHHCYLAERQRPVMHPVVQDGVVAAW